MYKQKCAFKMKVYGQCTNGKVQSDIYSEIWQICRCSDILADIYSDILADTYSNILANYKHYSNVAAEDNVPSESVI